MQTIYKGVKLSFYWIPQEVSIAAIASVISIGPESIFNRKKSKEQPSCLDEQFVFAYQTIVEIALTTK